MAAYPLPYYRRGKFVVIKILNNIDMPVKEQGKLLPSGAQNRKHFSEGILYPMVSV